MRILIPTDFSKCSIDAIEMAKQMAKKLNAEIHLLHVVSDFFPWNAISDDDKQADFNKIAIKKLSKIQDEMRQEGFATSYFMRNGAFLNEIEKHIESYDYDLIVMGSHGTSGKSEWFIGSNTQKTIRTLQNIVLVVKERMKQLSFDDLLYVTSFTDQEQESFRLFVDFIKPLGVKRIHLININTSGFFSSPSEEMKEEIKAFKNIAKDYEIISHMYSDYSVGSGVRHFCEDNNIDVISISNHARHPIKRVFQGSNVEIIVNHSQLPVLTIDYK